MQAQEPAWIMAARLAGVSSLQTDFEYLSARTEWESLRKTISQTTRPPNWLSAFVMGPLRMSTVSTGLPQIIMFNGMLYLVKPDIPFAVLRACNSLTQSRSATIDQQIQDLLMPYKSEVNSAPFAASDDEDGSLCTDAGAEHCSAEEPSADASHTDQVVHSLASLPQSSNTVNEAASDNSASKRVAIHETSGSAFAPKKARGSVGVATQKFHASQSETHSYRSHSQMPRGHQH